MENLWNSFQQLDIRIGTIIQAKHFDGARRPAFQLWIDFGEDLGVKKTSAQLTQLYTPEKLIGQQVVAIVNFPPKQIGKFMSEVLVLGAVEKNNHVILLQPDRLASNGASVG